jgi:hypothetical protein
MPMEIRKSCWRCGMWYSGLYIVGILLARLIAMVQRWHMYIYIYIVISMRNGFYLCVVGCRVPALCMIISQIAPYFPFLLCSLHTPQWILGFIFFVMWGLCDLFSFLEECNDPANSSRNGYYKIKHRPITLMGEMKGFI